MARREQRAQVGAGAVQVHQVLDLAAQAVRVGGQAQREEALQAVAYERRGEGARDRERSLPERARRQRVPPPRRRVAEAGGGDEPEALDPVRVLDGKPERGGATERMADDRYPVEVQLVEERREELAVEVKKL